MSNEMLAAYLENLLIEIKGIEESELTRAEKNIKAKIESLLDQLK